jgi:hypothetical protein
MAGLSLPAMRKGIASSLGRHWRTASPLRIAAAAWIGLVVVVCVLAPVLPLPGPTNGDGPIAALPGSDATCCRAWCGAGGRPASSPP